jgi:SAM-dependent methyltransferase
MKEEVPESRWKAAQVSEAKYWKFADANAAELARIVHEKVADLQVATQAVPAFAASRGTALEIGIGPRGIGVSHFFPVTGVRIGVEPLEVSRTIEGVPPPLVELLRECWREYSHVRARGEELPLPTGTMDNVFCYNVLDHVQDPLGILREGLRVLKPGGYFFLGCDVLSLASLAKFHVYYRPTHPASLEVICHPFRFQAAQLSKLVKKAGFSIVWVRRRKRETLERLIGHAYRLVMVARKPMGA